MKKNRLIKNLIVIGIITIAFFFIFPIMNIIYNSTSDDKIKIAIYRDDLLETHYIEVDPNGEITYWVGNRNTHHPSKIDMSKIFLSKTINIFGQQKIKLSKDEINEIFNSADEVISIGNLTGGVIFGGYCSEFHYKGIVQKIFFASDNENADLYWLMHKITDYLPKSIEFDTMIFFNDYSD